MIVVLIGPPGAGKTKQSKLLKDREHITWLSAGQLLRDLKNPEVDEVMNRGDLVDNDFVNETLRKHLDQVNKSTVVVLDGFPRHKHQAKWLIEYCAETNQAISLVLHLYVSPEVSRQRLQGRGEERDNPQSIDERLEYYSETIEPIIDYFAATGISIKKIDGNQSVEAVFSEIDNVLSHVHNR